MATSSRYLCALLLGLILSTPSYAEQVSPAADSTFISLFATPADKLALQQLAEQLSSGDTAQGQFTQYRYLTVLQRPLVSHGEFVFQSDLGLAWVQLRPFASTLVLSQDTLVQIDSDGQRQVNRADDNPQAQALARTIPLLMSALLRGDIAPLSQQFSLHLIQEASGWQLGLIPKDPMLAQALPKMVMQGQSQIKSLTLLNSNGDRSLIEFEQISEQPLSPQQRALFGTDNFGTDNDADNRPDARR